MKPEKSWMKVVRSPNSWGLKAIDRVGNRVSLIHNRLGFEPDKPWELFSLETYEGKMSSLSKYMDSYLIKIFENLGYEDRKAIFWSWPLPGGEYPNGSPDAPGVLRSLYISPGIKKPEDLVCLELVDVYSQLLGRIGFEFLRLEELLNIWKLTARQKQYIGAASMSRNMIEATASLYSFAAEVAKQWSRCKTTTGSVYESSTGGRIDRARAVEVDNFRRLLWSSRNELKLHDIKKSGIDETLAEWRHQDLFDQLKAFDIGFRREVTNEPKKTPVPLVRELNELIVLSNTFMTLKADYELLCNVVHPSLGSFQLFSGSPLSDKTYGFHHIVVGKNKGRLRNRSTNSASFDEISSFGIFCTAISESMVIASSIFLSVLEFLTAIGDDIALTASIEQFSFHKTWRYPKALGGIDCLCTCRNFGGCEHTWGTDGPRIPTEFRIDLQISKN